MDQRQIRRVHEQARPPYTSEDVRTPEQLAQVLRWFLNRHRRRRGDTTYEALGRALNLSTSTIGAYFNGDIVPPIIRFDQLLRQLGADAEELRSWGGARDHVAEQARPKRHRPSSVRTSAGTTDSAVRPSTSTAQLSLVPHQLPDNVTSFVGRSELLDELDSMLDATHHANTAAPVVISAVTGTAGVGKTALALRWAHSVRHQFPDGELYVNLRGYDYGQPMSPNEALDSFLDALGVSAPPSTLDARAALYRSLLFGRRMLVLLDNAGSPEQVRSLIPGSAGCFTIVTSRDELAGLVVSNGARSLRLDLLTSEDSVSLLTKLVGRDRAQAEPCATEMLARVCAYLPLALRVAAHRAARRPSARIADLVAELSDEARRLDLLDPGSDPRMAVRTVFSWSYRHLPPQHARLFRLLGLHPGPYIGAAAVSALTGLPYSDVQMSMNALASAFLVEERADGLFQMHDLLRVYTVELTAETESPQERHDALARLVDYYLHSTKAASGHIDQYTRMVEPSGTEPVFRDYAQALAWLDVERPNIVAVTQLAADVYLKEACWHLADTLMSFLDLRRSWDDWVATSKVALSTARRAANHRAEAWFLNQLGQAYSDQRHNDHAIEYFRQALRVNQLVGDTYVESRALAGLSIVYRALGQLQDAVSFGRAALDVARRSGHKFEESRALNILGKAYGDLGRHDEELAHLTAALRIRRDLCHRAGEADTLTSISGAFCRRGRYLEAAEYGEQAYSLWCQLEHIVGQARALTNVGLALHYLGRTRDGVERCEQALVLACDAEHRYTQGQVLCVLSEIQRRCGEFLQARDRAAQALEISRFTNHRGGEARARHNLGLALNALNDTDAAIEELSAALALFANIGSPETDRVHAQLKTVLSLRQPSHEL